MDGKNIDKNTRVVDTLALRRTAKEAKRYVVLMRLLKILAIILIAIVAAAYAVSYFYDKYGSFTVKISKYDMGLLFRRLLTIPRAIQGSMRISSMI